MTQKQKLKIQFEKVLVDIKQKKKKLLVKYQPKIDFSDKSIIEHKESHCIMKKEVIHQEEIILNPYIQITSQSL